MHSTSVNVMRCLVALTFLTISGIEGRYIKVASPVGTVIGFVNETIQPDSHRHTVAIFSGIPYAEAPMGTRRFEKPVRKSSLGNAFLATTESYACPQHPFIMKQWVPGPSDMSEDCLKLNVYVPLQRIKNSNGTDMFILPVEKKAVMVWIHGGAYIIGQSRIYNGQRLAAFGDVIVVTINYRLGPFGFLSTGDGIAPGNLGLWDQFEAISWVHDNIEYFGGDPQRVTLFGESAGGASGLYQLLNTDNRGKIQRVIASSGSYWCPWAFNEQVQTSIREFTLRLADRVGCKPSFYMFSAYTHKLIIDCLKRKSSESLVLNSMVGTLEEALFRADWIPIIDGYFIKPSALSLMEAWSTGKNISSSEYEGTMFSDVDVLMGTNTNDGEVIAKTSVQQFLTTKTGFSIEDPGLSQDDIKNVYIPQILKDKFKTTKNLTSFRKYFDVYFSSPADISSRTQSDNTQRDISFSQVVQAVLDMTTDYEFLMPSLQTLSSIASLSTNKDKQRYLYRFDHKYPFTNSPKWVQGPSHGDDLPYIFGFPATMAEAFNITSTVERAEWDLATTMMTYWTNFAKTGSPNRPRKVKVQWPIFDVNTMDYLLLNKNMTSANVRKNPYPERVKLWTEILSKVDNASEGSQNRVIDDTRSSDGSMVFG